MDSLLAGRRETVQKRGGINAQAALRQVRGCGLEQMRQREAFIQEDPAEAFRLPYRQS